MNGPISNDPQGGHRSPAPTVDLASLIERLDWLLFEISDDLNYLNSSHPTDDRRESPSQSRQPGRSAVEAVY
jgi:hypothetical protein